MKIGKKHKSHNKIKEKPALEQALKEEEAQYQLVVENALVGIYQLDLRGRFVFVNRAFAKMVGYRPKNLIGRHFSLVLPPYKISKGEKVFKEIVANDQNGRFGFGPQRIKESYLHHQKGHDLYVQYSFNFPIKAKKRGYLSRIALTGMVIDITEHKKLEEELMTRTKILENFKTAIEHEKVQVEAILKSIGDGVIATDTFGRIIMMNKTAEEMLGWTAEELFGKSMAEALPMMDQEGEESIPQEEHPVFVALSTRRTITTRSNTHYGFYICKNQRRFPVTITASPVRLNKTIIGAIQTFRDVTKTREIDKAKSEFVSLASHQLRTPLTIISLYSDMLQSQNEALSEEQKKYLTEITNANKRMVKLVDMILNVSRIDLGVLNVVSMPIDFIEISETIWKELLPSIREKGLHFIKNYDENLPILNSDPKLIEVILENLLSNAIKYISAKGQVELTIKPNGSAVLIKVSDTGYGIPLSQQSKIFSKMFRADNVLEKDPEGTGLGLYIVKSMVEKMGGKIWFESEEGQGTTFFVSLPAIPVNKRARTIPQHVSI
ncbi:MAG: hypothetical protein A3C71_02050 [Candidatus Yanofskybacteria bacterium RIFCSPHIGHO2_02_FULL_43_15c]|uniref:histidine kinase n=2 Tax=Candidatus Yanofskyibacteriota TaxID=1752733 RepID=A0A1F8H5A0_9BACT|nr:MAG: hypothetical protein A3C71_02050 [Candidatus Yanofskybacteria bacterium RIFCSPHIGHO2_02_FULL_43_15c]OGN32767.1 MAG: hypothetical protein A3I92_01490 [Candidatus Yanofskybacteria bacterium RIFCSPLOWO2_02_FULL_43_10b]